MESTQDKEDRMIEEIGGIASKLEVAGWSSKAASTLTVAVQLRLLADTFDIMRRNNDELTSALLSALNGDGFLRIVNAGNSPFFTG